MFFLVFQGMAEQYLHIIYIYISCENRKELSVNRVELHDAAKDVLVTYEDEDERISMGQNIKDTTVKIQICARMKEETNEKENSVTRQEKTIRE